jgi:hypothetical protein
MYSEMGIERERGLRAPFIHVLRDGYSERGLRAPHHVLRDGYSEREV